MHGKKEREHLEQLKATLNKNIPSRSKKDYYADNKEQVLEQCKEYRENHNDNSADFSAPWKLLVVLLFFLTCKLLDHVVPTYSTSVADVQAHVFKDTAKPRPRHGISKQDHSHNAASTRQYTAKTRQTHGKNTAQQQQHCKDTAKPRQRHGISKQDYSHDTARTRLYAAKTRQRQQK